MSLSLLVGMTVEGPFLRYSLVIVCFRIRKPVMKYSQTCPNVIQPAIYDSCCLLSHLLMYFGGDIIYWKAYRPKEQFDQAPRL